MDSILLSGILFVGFLALFSSSLLGPSYTIVSIDNQTVFSNITNSNVTVGSGSSITGFKPFPTCNFTSDFWSNIGAAATCGGNMIGWLFGFMFTSSDIQWIAIITVAIGAVILYRIIGLLKPFGGS